MHGRLIWFNPDKRHGFIRTEDGERLLVEETGFEPGHLLGDRCAGTHVSFERAEADGQAHAIRVTVVAEYAGGRARARRR
jgi:cold shock CspA family protein